MGSFDKPTATLDRPAKQRTGSPFAGLGERLARTFAPVERPPRRDLRYRTEPEPQPDWDGIEPRFPIARQGYDCAVVDEHVAELERELSELDQELTELRRRTPSDNEVADEIQRIGEQTSSILLAAHDKAQETKRLAQEEADRCVADAAANALKITEEAQSKARQLEQDTESLRRQRTRLLDDVRQLGTTLCSLADEGADRFAGEAQDTQPDG
jgi:uncharacterized phage infection (PIP) family protein YhgE